MNNYIDTNKASTSYKLVILLLSAFILTLSIIPRFQDITRVLPDYSIDENEIVESSIAFMSGDFNPYWQSYGPLYAYLLAGLNFLIIKIQGLSYYDYISKIFFEPTDLYIVARLFNSTLNLILVIIGFLIAKKFFGLKTAFTALPLLIFPFADIIVDFKVRVDTLLAIWSSLTILCTFEIYKSGKTLWYVLCGVTFGFAFATKPLAAILIFPTILISHLLHFYSFGQSNQSQFSVNYFLKLAKFLLFTKKFILFYLSSLGSFLLVNPYALIDIKQFLRDQFSRVLTEGGRNYTKGFDVTRFFENLGYGFIIFSIVSCIYVVIYGWKNKNYISFILVSYPIVYYLAFAPGSAREYWYVPIIPILCICIAKAIVDFVDIFESKFLQNILVLLILSLIIFQPGFNIINQISANNKYNPYQNYTTSLAGKRWIEENIVPGSKFLYYGFYPLLPRIIDERPEIQGDIGEYFMYGRINNELYKNLYYKAYKKFIVEQNKPVFNLTKYRQKCTDNKTVAEMLNKGNYNYLVTNCDIAKELNLSQKIVKFWGGDNYPYGDPLWFFKLD